VLSAIPILVCCDVKMREEQQKMKGDDNTEVCTRCMILGEPVLGYENFNEITWPPRERRDKTRRYKASIMLLLSTVGSLCHYMLSWCTAFMLTSPPTLPPARQRRCKIHVTDKTFAGRNTRNMQRRLRNMPQFLGGHSLPNLIREMTLPESKSRICKPLRPVCLQYSCSKIISSMVSIYADKDPETSSQQFGRAPLYRNW
jgi:hypothetical protein